MLLSELQHYPTFQSVKRFYPNFENGNAIFKIGIKSPIKSENKTQKRVVALCAATLFWVLFLSGYSYIKRLKGYPSQLGFALFILDVECKYSLTSELYGYDSAASTQDRCI
ncbi:hypothetical protein APA_4356 [Pseudanabaena sp. lw0831]|nr:hypothetical protein APA_4356 [Pseudanabaena sp. lw0831]